MSAYDCKELVNIMLEAYGLIAQSSRNVPEKVDKWVKLNNKNLRHLRLLLQSAASAPEKQKFLSTIAFLKGFKDKLKCLLKRGEGVRERRSDRVKWQDLEVAFNNRMRSGVITNLKQLDIAAFMKDSQVLFQSRIKTALKKETAVKVYTILAAEYVITKADKEITEIKYFNTKAEAIFQNTNLKQWFSLNVQQPIQRDMEEFQERDSGWTLRAILNLCVHINKYNALRDSSYVELPYTIKSYRGLNPAKWFVDELLQLAENIETVFWCPIPIETLTWEQEQSFQRATSCHICEKVLELDRVRDHCHWKVIFSRNNNNNNNSAPMAMIFHNLTGYDSHFLIRDIAQCIPGRVNLLPINKEKFISFTKHIDGSDINFKFIDSFRFMASSLDKLSSYLEDVNILKQEFNKDNQLTEEKYVLLLAEVFENFRTSCLKAYGLDPPHYYTAPGLTWDAMLKYTNIELELLTDIDKVMFIERGIRGGISQCCNRYSRANNIYMGTDYDADQYSKYLIYYDVNNLYGWAMQQSLPYGGFKWMTETAISQTDFSSVDDESAIGYILELDLEYPEQLHDDHRDLPLCPQHMKLPGSTYSKLMTTLHSKERYVLHYRNLKQALANGLQLQRIHRVLQFNQRPWLKVYIDLNSSMRKEAKNEFEKNLYKLMNNFMNAVFGKTMENVRKRVDLKIVTKWDGRYGAEALIIQPNFHSRSILDENLTIIELTKTEVNMDKPIYVGLCVLKLSKTLVYSFHYDYMKKQFGDDCKLLDTYTDTDSLIYELRNIDIYEFMKRDIEHFDTSDYSENNTFGMPVANKKVVGLMKNECNGRIMTEFVGLRSKMYSIRVEGQDKNMSTQTREQCIIRSHMHNVFSEKQVKLALSPHDDRRYLLRGETDTLPWGHYKIMQTD
ncbi:uncharacterized protein LOC100113970 [Nasonia vitripennis]|uniref:DNA-directed DNA polymerase n=1 Tax=Nasonia vitripennis TaxID=7425 RepID=A0A7M7QF50_NASVI|nr:uncharacterized protein LOC100113970 [Nasonia vitripennis]